MTSRNNRESIPNNRPATALGQEANSLKSQTFTNKPDLCSDELTFPLPSPPP